jgi:hypothetical protein
MSEVVTSFFQGDDADGEATPETNVREVAEEAAAPLAEVFAEETSATIEDLSEANESVEGDLAADLGFTEEPAALKDRIKTISKQRRDARAAERKAKDALEAATAARTEAEQRLEKLGLLEPIAKSYERFGDKAAEQATRDVAMIESLEELSTSDQSVASVAQRLVAEANRRLGTSTTTKRPPVSEITTTTCRLRHRRYPRRHQAPLPGYPSGQAPR